jgi:hypothetical protein
MAAMLFFHVLHNDFIYRRSIAMYHPRTFSIAPTDKSVSLEYCEFEYPKIRFRVSV